MATIGESKSHKQPVLAANVPRILAELHQLAAATMARSPATDRRASSAGAPTMVIRGK